MRYWAALGFTDAGLRVVSWLARVLTGWGGRLTGLPRNYGRQGDWFDCAIGRFH